jgi:hypothetical protein
MSFAHIPRGGEGQTRGDVDGCACRGRAWALAMSAPSLGPCGHLRGAAATAAAGGCWLVVVGSRGMMGQCLATGGCQTLQLLVIGRLIINKYVNSIIN